MIVCCIYDVDVCEVVIDGFLLDCWVFMGEGVEFVVVVLECVGVDCVEGDVVVFGVFV